MTDTALVLAAAGNGTHSSEGSPGETGGSVVQRIEEHPRWLSLSRLPVVLTARIPLRAFTVRDLLSLEAGQLIASDWSTTEDIPVKTGRLHLAWSEFEVVDESMAMRLTRLA